MVVKKKKKVKKIDLVNGIDKDELEAQINNVVETEIAHSRVSRVESRQIFNALREVNLDRLGGAHIAYLFGVSQTVINNFRLQGCPVDKEDRYSVREVIEWLLGRIKKAKSNAGTKNSSVDYLRIQRAKLIEIQIEEKQGKLIEREIIDRTFSKYITDARTILETLPDTVVSLIVDDELAKTIKGEASRLVNETLRSLREAAVKVNELVTKELERKKIEKEEELKQQLEDSELIQ